MPNATDLEIRGDTTVLSWIRRALLWVLLLAALGTGAELVLLEHYEDPWQVLPIVLLAVGAVLVVALLVGEGRTKVLLLRWVMLTFVVSGALGLWRHYHGNVEFELEMYPDLAGLALFREAMTGATPALAPGAMSLLGAIGLLYCYGHPALRRTEPAHHFS